MLKIVRRRLNTAEIDKFARMKSDWWDQSGQNAALHSLNALRIGFIDEVHKGNEHFFLFDFFVWKNSF